MARHLTRLDCGRRLEPAGDRVLHGAGQDPDAFGEYCRAIGERLRPALYVTYLNLDSDVPAYFARLEDELDEHAPAQIVPQLGLFFYRRRRSAPPGGA